MGQLSTDMHVVCQFMGKWAPGIHFYGQYKSNIYFDTGIDLPANYNIQHEKYVIR